MRKATSPWLVLVCLVLGFFMILLDTTIVNIAIPSMIDGLHASLDQILWVINAYVLVYAVLLITAGRLGDLFGPKRLFLAGMLVFTLASAACGLAGSPGWLIGARVAQGVGGALLTPQTLSLITHIFPAEKRGAAFGIWGAVAGLAAISGPTLGGFIVTHWGWQWIFYVNVPIGVVGLAMGLAFVPDLRPGRHHRLDLTGTALATIGLFGITFGLIEGEKYRWNAAIWATLAAGVAVLGVFLVTQYRNRAEPLVPFEVFADRNFALMSYVAAAIGFAMFGMFVPLVIFLQSVLGLDALRAGLTLAPMSVVSMVVAPFAGRLADRYGGKYILVTGLSLFTAGMALVLAAAKVTAGRWDFLPGLVVAGLGLGCTFAPMTTVAMRNIGPRMAGAASGVFNTTRQLGMVIGSAAVGALLQNQLVSKLTAAAQAQAAALDSRQRAVFVDNFTHAASHLQVGTGQSGVKLPPGTPQPVKDAAVRAFHEGYVNAMRPTLVLPIVVLASAVLCCLAIKRRDRTGAATREPVASPPAASRSSG